MNSAVHTPSMFARRARASRVALLLGACGCGLFAGIAPGWAAEVGLTAVNDEQILTTSSPNNDGLFIASLTTVARAIPAPLIGNSEVVNAALPAGASVTQAEFVNGSSQIVYAASTIGDNQFNDLFVVERNALGQATQLNAQRNTAIDAPQIFGAALSSEIVAFSIRDLSDETDRLVAVDTTNPGVETDLNDDLPSGAQISILLLSPDGRSAAYRVDDADGAPSVWVSFTQGAANAQQVSPNNPGSSFNPNEFAFSPDSQNFFWLAGQDDDTSPAPLVMVSLDADQQLISDSVQVNAASPSNQRVIEFEVSADSTSVVYRATVAGSNNAAGSFIVELDSPGSATQISPPVAADAGSTLFEDIEFFGDDVIYNSAQDSPSFVDLFQVTPNGQGNATNLTTAAPLDQAIDPLSLPGVSHMVVSRNDSFIAIIDNQPAVDLFVLQPAFTSEAANPILFTAGLDFDESSVPVADGPPLIAFNFGADLLAAAVDADVNSALVARELFIALPDISATGVSLFDDGLTTIDQFSWVPPAATLVSSILPASRSGTVGSTITAFATIINASPQTAFNCSIRPLSTAPIAFTYQFTDPVTNAPSGTPNTPVDLAAGAAQSYVISATLLDEFEAQDLSFRFGCDNADAVATISGVNSLLLSGSGTPVPDIVALAATPTNDGFIALAGGAASAAFSVATVNVGAAGPLTVEIDSNGIELPLQLGLCETDPATGACLTPPVPAPGTVATLAATNQTQTFSFFVTSTAEIVANPALLRLRVIFRDANGAIRGQTSVAVNTDG